MLAVDRLGKLGDAVQPLFITIDPEKDTPEHLKAYVALFHPRLLGLSGTAKEIHKVASAYKVYFGKADPSQPANPNIDHSSFVYLIDAGGKYVGYFPPGTPSDRIVEVLRPRIAPSG